MTSRRVPDATAPQHDTRLITRRHAVGLGLGAGLVAVAAGAVTFAFASSGSNDSVTAWQLATDWADPRGPHGKTRLTSRASRSAARYRFARTQQDAESMNLFVGSWAPAVEVELDRSTFNTLWSSTAGTWTNPWNGQSIDVLDVRHGVSSPAKPRIASPRCSL